MYKDSLETTELHVYVVSKYSFFFCPLLIIITGFTVLISIDKKEVSVLESQCP